MSDFAADARAIATAVREKMDRGFCEAEILARATLCFRLGLSMPELESLFAEAWTCWELHEDYVAPDTSKSAWFWTQVVMLGVWKHKPGRYGHDESYVIGTPSDIFSHYEWANKRWVSKRWGGEFIGLRPIVDAIELPDGVRWAQMIGLKQDAQLMDADPDSGMFHTVRLAPFFVGCLPYSYSGGGAGYLGRMALKSRLPATVRPLITKARRANRMNKISLITSAGAEYCNDVSEFEKWLIFVKWISSYNAEVTDRIKLSDLPSQFDWLRAKTKGQLWLDHWVRPDALHTLSRLIEPMDFWRAATGKIVDPADIPDLFVPPLFRGSGVEMSPSRPRAKKSKKTVIVKEDSPVQTQLGLSI